MSLILSIPTQRPGNTQIGTAYWRYTTFSDALPIDIRSSVLPSPMIRLVFEGWINESSFNSGGVAIDSYFIDITFAEFLQINATVQSLGSLDYISPLEEKLKEYAGFESGIVVPSYQS